MPYYKKQTGNLGEDLAEKFLKKSGYKILSRNLANMVGEIDILARQKDVIVIVEVKTKSGPDFGKGFEMVNYFKRKKLISLAKQVQSKYPDVTVRIDIISIDTSQNPPEIEHFINAVEDNE